MYIKYTYFCVFLFVFIYVCLYVFICVYMCIYDTVQTAADHQDDILQDLRLQQLVEHRAVQERLHRDLQSQLDALEEQLRVEAGVEVSGVCVYACMRVWGE